MLETELLTIRSLESQLPPVHPDPTLDVSDRSRTSGLPWRGQFTPQLVERLLADFPEARSVVDPFVGSGTVLFEALRLGKSDTGAEINAPALEFARLAELSQVSEDTREALLRCAWERIVFAPGGEDDSDLADSLDRALAQTQHSPACNALTRVVATIAGGDGASPTTATIEAAIAAVGRIVRSLPTSTAGDIRVFDADARSLPLASGSADVVVTSPPYINVFNYHQQYRKSSERFLRANPLAVAASEIGSNRKNRGNRFKTVIQYAIDMHDAVRESRRILRESGRLVLVVGRESRVRGVPFENGKILALLSVASGGVIERWRERRFTNRFGEVILEDVLTVRFGPALEASSADGNIARLIGEYALESGLVGAPAEQQIEIRAAMSEAGRIAGSPVRAASPRSPLFGVATDCAGGSVTPEYAGASASSFRMRLFEESAGY